MRRCMCKVNLRDQNPLISFADGLLWGCDGYHENFLIWYLWFMCIIWTTISFHRPFYWRISSPHHHAIVNRLFISNLLWSEVSMNILANKILLDLSWAKLTMWKECVQYLWSMELKSELKNVIHGPDQILRYELYLQLKQRIQISLHIHDWKDIKIFI